MQKNSEKERFLHEEERTERNDGIDKGNASRRYDIPLEVIDSWESGSALPPADIMEMLQNAADHYIPRSKEETMSLPMTVFELKWCCEYWIRKGYGERSVLLSDDTAESGFHGMYYGLNLIEDSDTYMTLN